MDTGGVVALVLVLLLLAAAAAFAWWWFYWRKRMKKRKELFMASKTGWETVVKCIGNCTADLPYTGTVVKSVVTN